MSMDVLERTMTLMVNGSPREVREGLSLAELLVSLDLDPRMIVVEHNRVILRERDQFSALALQDGDVLELVHFVGGG